MTEILARRVDVLSRLIRVWRARGDVCRRQRIRETALEPAAFACLEMRHTLQVATLTRELESLGMPASALRIDPPTYVERLHMIEDIERLLAVGVATYNLCAVRRSYGLSPMPTDEAVMEHFEARGYAVAYGALPCMCKVKCAGHYGYTFTSKK